MAWILLILAGLLEVAWAFTMKLSNGFTKINYSFITIASLVISLIMLSISMRTIPLGTAYTIWTGIGALGAFVVGILFLGESATPMRMLAAVLIVSGLLLMKLSSS